MTADVSNTPARYRHSPNPGGSGMAVAALALSVPLALAGLWAWLPMHDYLRNAVVWISDTGPYGALAFVAVFVLCALVGIPRTILNIAAGVIFSYPLAIAAALAGAATAYTLTFTVARTVARDCIERRIADSPQVKRVLALVEKEGFKLIVLVRMNPFIPGVVKGYGFGTTSIAFRTYLIASVLGFLPIALAHVDLGWAGGAAMLHDCGQPSALEAWLLAGGVAVSVLLVAGVYAHGRRALNKRYEED